MMWRSCLLHAVSPNLSPSVRKHLYIACARAAAAAPLKRTHPRHHALEDSSAHRRWLPSHTLNTPYSRPY